MYLTKTTKIQDFIDITPPAVILAAGAGSRLDGVNGGLPKPLTPILGMTLLERSILSCREAGVLEFYVVIGYNADKMISYIKTLEQKLSVSIQPVVNPDWKKGNGTSALSVAPYIHGSFFLLMCDHLFDPAILELLLSKGKSTADCLLAVDRHSDRVLELEDATKVQFNGDVITSIGKEMKFFNAVDTGLFLCQPSLFEALRDARDMGQYSLSAGFEGLIRNREFRAVTIDKRFWFDVDTPKSLSHARSALLQSLSKPDDDGIISRHLNRPLSRWLSKMLVRTPISPNGISIMSFAIGIVGAFMFSIGEFAWTITAGLVVQMASIVDGCDGEVARLRFQSSKFGGWFDTVLDRYADTAIVVGVSFGYWLVHPHPAVWLGGIFALAGFTMASYAKKEFEIRYHTKLSGGLLGRLIKRDLRIFAIMLGAFANLSYEFMLLVGLLSHVGIGWMLFKGYRQTKVTTSENIRSGRTVREIGRDEETATGIPKI